MSSSKNANGTETRTKSICTVLMLVAALALPGFIFGDDYYRHMFFDNSINADYYFYSAAGAAAPSFVENKNGKLPVETKTFVTPPNALRITWESRDGGTWQAEVNIVNFRNRFPGMVGHTLSFWVYAAEAAIAKEDLPLIVLSTSTQGLQVAQFPASFTNAAALGEDRKSV